MAKLKFGAWIPTYAWSGKKTDPKNMRRIRESIVKCEKYGIDVWVIDHLLSAPGLYGNAWLEPLSSLAYAAALTSKVDIATGILVLPVRHPVLLAKEISTLCHLSNNRYVFGVGPGWYAREYEVTGSRIQERGKRTDEIIEAVTLLLTKPNASFHGKYYHFDDVTIDPRPPKMPKIWVSGGSRVPDPGEHDVPVIATTVMDRIVKAGNWLSRCSGTQEWVKRDWGLLQQHAQGARPRPEEAHLRALQLHPPGGHAEPRQGGGRLEGAVHQDDGHAPDLRAPAGVVHDRVDRSHQHAHRRPGEGGAQVPGAGAGDGRSGPDRPHGQEGDAALQVEAAAPCAYGFYLPTRGQTATPEALETLVARGGGARLRLGDDRGPHRLPGHDQVEVSVHGDAAPSPGSGDALEQLALMAFVAGKTRPLRLVSSVMILPHRNPVVTAKMLATIDVLSRGRVTVGVGVGWLREEFEALGAPDFDRRGAVSDEYLRIFKALWTQYARLVRGRVLPLRLDPLPAAPVQKPHPPIWVGGHSKAALRRVARYGDGWHPVGANPAVPLRPAELRASLDELYRLTEAEGRDPRALTISYKAPIYDARPGARRAAPSGGRSRGASRPDRGRHRHLRAPRRERADLRLPQREPRREPRAHGALRPPHPRLIPSLPLPGEGAG